jgi:DNA-binding CsgD family transcriptional regulator
MKHLYFLFNLLFLIGGASGIILAFLIYRRNRNRLIKWYIWTLLVWTVNELTGFASFYTREIVQIQSRILDSLLEVLSSFTLGIFTYLLPVLVFKLARKILSPRTRIIFLSIAVIIALPQSLQLPENIGMLLYRNIGGLLKTLSFYGLLYYVAFFINSIIRKIEDRGVKKILKALVVLQLVFYPVMFTETVLIGAGVLRYEIGAFSFFYFLLNILWLYFVSRYLYFPEIKIIDETNALENYSTIYNISSREKEVAQLLMEGLSYREIGAKLFISYETVKSHVNNIYIKSKVKSKMELAGLIRKCDRE